jgi:two-component system, NarL family, response regulator
MINTDTKTIRVILVDDHPIVRDGIKGLLRNASDIHIVGEADNGEAALRLIEKEKADVLLLDMELPDMPGTEVALQVAKNYPGLKILSLSAHDDSVYVRQLLELGAAGYLMKEEAPEVILDAVRGVAHGQQGWISRGIAAQISGWMQSDVMEGSSLTPREHETLGLLVEGKTNQAIAAELRISEKTVEKHIKAIFEKLNVSSRVEAAVVAIKRGIVKK